MGPVEAARIVSVMTGSASEWHHELFSSNFWHGRVKKPSQDAAPLLVAIA